MRDVSRIVAVSPVVGLEVDGKVLDPNLAGYSLYFILSIFFS